MRRPLTGFPPHAVVGGFPPPLSLAVLVKSAVPAFPQAKGPSDWMAFAVHSVLLLVQVHGQHVFIHIRIGSGELGFQERAVAVHIERGRVRAERETH